MHVFAYLHYLSVPVFVIASLCTYFCSKRCLAQRISTKKLLTLGHIFVLTVSLNVLSLLMKLQ